LLAGSIVASVPSSYSSASGYYLIGMNESASSTRRALLAWHSYAFSAFAILRATALGAKRVEKATNLIFHERRVTDLRNIFGTIRAHLE
jgi:hypothetical protein